MSEQDDRAARDAQRVLVNTVDLLRELERALANATQMRTHAGGDASRLLASGRVAGLTEAVRIARVFITDEAVGS